MNNLTIENCGCVFDNVITDEYGNRDLYLEYVNVCCKSHTKNEIAIKESE